MLSIMKCQQFVLSNPMGSANLLQPMNLIPSPRICLAVFVRVHFEEGASERTDMCQPRLLSRLCRADALLGQAARGR